MKACLSNRLDEFPPYRTRMNDRIAEIDHLGIKRLFNLDNDCIDYHILQCVQAGWKDEELYEALNVALVVGGSIVIPHLRHAVESLDLARGKAV